MENEKLYQEVAEMINRDDPLIVGVSITPAFLKLLSLQMTPDEARLATMHGRLPDGGAAWLAGFAADGLDSRARPEEIPVQRWQQLRV